MGYGPGGRGHTHPPAGAAALGLLPDSEELSGVRKESMYDPAMVGPGIGRPLIWITGEATAIRTALLDAIPELSARLERFS